MMKRIVKVTGQLPRKAFRVIQANGRLDSLRKPWKVFVYGCHIGWPNLNELAIDVIARHSALQTNEVVMLFAGADIPKQKQVARILFKLETQTEGADPIAIVKELLLLA